MKSHDIALLVLLPILSGCDTHSPLQINSKNISAQQAQTLIDNITQHYPKASLEEQQSIADVAVNAIDTLIYVEGGSFDMGDFKAPCSIPSNTR